MIDCILPVLHAHGCRDVPVEQMYEPAAFQRVQEERGKLLGMMEYLTKENEKLAAQDKTNEEDMETYSANRGLRTCFQVRSCGWRARRDAFWVSAGAAVFVCVVCRRPRVLL